MVKIYEYKDSAGYSYSLGSGFGADSISSVPYLNFPEGYVYLRNLIFREDDVLRPMYSAGNFAGALPVAPYAIGAPEYNTVYAIHGIGVSYTTNESTWSNASWGGVGSAPTLDNTTYIMSACNDIDNIFKGAKYSSPLYIINDN